ncbi:MAG: hypothetical protein ACM3N5_11875 [Candidatus Eiseniibacteriota bacterium]
MMAGRSRRKRSEKPLTLDERVARVVKLVAEHHGVAPSRISQSHRDEIQRIASGLLAFEEQRKQDAAVDATARSRAHAQRVAPTLATSLRVLRKLPPEWWRWAEADRDMILDAVQTLHTLCTAISKDPNRKSSYAFAQRMAVWGAERVCDVCGVPKSLSKQSTFLRVAAALYGDPMAVWAMQKYYRGPRQGRQQSAKAPQKK